MRHVLPVAVQGRSALGGHPPPAARDASVAAVGRDGAGSAPSEMGADVLPGAVAVQRVQRVQDRAGNQVQLPRVPVCVCHHVILLAVTFCDGFVSLPVHRKR